MKRISELTFEIEESVVLKQGGYFITEYCPRCRETVDLVSPEILSLINRVSEREIFRLVEAAEIYFVEATRLAACPSCYQTWLAVGGTDVVSRKLDSSGG